MPNKQAKPKRRIKVDSLLPFLFSFSISPFPPLDRAMHNFPPLFSPPPPSPTLRSTRFRIPSCSESKSARGADNDFRDKEAGKASLLEPKTMRRALIIPLLDPLPPLPRFDGTFCFFPSPQEYHLPPPPPLPPRVTIECTISGVIDHFSKGGGGRGKRGP